MSEGFTFIASGGDRLSYDVKVTLGEDASLEEVLNAFEHFLRASGFYISMDDYISIEEGLEIDFTPEESFDEDKFDTLLKDVDKIITKSSNVVSLHNKEGQDNDD